MQVSAVNCETLSELDPHALGLTYVFEALPDGEPYAVTIRFEGRRAGVKRRLSPGDRFEVSTAVERVLPGSGRVAVTTRVTDLAPGEWQVVARPTIERDRSNRARSSAAAAPRLPGASGTGVTSWAPVVNVRAPGVHLGAWPALVALGAAAALSVQALLAAHLHLPVARILLVSLLACLLGLAGAKLYYLALHPAERRRALYAGMCIQGFVLAAAATLITGVWLAGIPVGRVLDITAPGLMLGMTIGRFGCFFGGCCAGRPTASRWGLWSSDRRLGVRRIPTQLIEAALAAALAVAALLILLRDSEPSPSGTVFVAALAAYTVGRQLLFPLRGLPRQTRHGRLIVMLVAAVILVADLVVAIVA